MKTADFLNFYFSIIALGTSIIASEVQAKGNVSENTENWIKTMWVIGNVSTIFLILSIVSKYILILRWLKISKIYTELDTLHNTGRLKWMIVEILTSLVMPYGSLYNKVYYESSNELSEGIPFQYNDLLLCFCLFFRIPFLFRMLLSLS